MKVGDIVTTVRSNGFYYLITKEEPRGTVEVVVIHNPFDTSLGIIHGCVQKEMLIKQNVKYYKGERL